MAVAFVQSKKAQGPPGASISSYTVAFDSNVTAGNLIAVFTAWGVSGRTITISDSLGNTYTQVDNDATSNTWSFYAKNIAGGACTVTVTLSGAAASGYRTVAVHEISGADTTAPLDANSIQAQASATHDSTDAVSSGSDTTTTNGCYIFGACIRTDDIPTVAFSPGTNFTGRESNSDGTNLGMRSEDRIQASAGSVAATFTFSAAANWSTTTVMMAFKPAASGTTHTDTGQGTAGFTASGVRNTDHLRSGASAAGFTASGADVVEFVESGKADAGFTASGADVAEFAELGSGKAEFSASGSKAVEYVETGTGSMGSTAFSARVVEYAEAGYAALGFTAGGSVGGTTYEKTALGALGFSGLGSRAVERSRTGQGSVGFTVAGVAINERIRAGAGALGFAASSSRAVEFLRTGTGPLGWKGEGFTSDRVLTKAGGAAMECFGSGGFRSGVAGSDASLFEAFALRGGRTGMPLMPVSRR